MKRRDFLALGLAASATLASGAKAAPSDAPVPAGAPIKWKMATTWPKNFPGLGTGAQFLADAITRASGGRLEVSVFGAGELVPAFDALDAVAGGTVQIGHGAPYYWKGKAPATQFLACTPFGLTAQEQNAWFDFGGGQELADEIYKGLGCKFFPAGNSGTQMGGWYNKPIASMADLKGLKIRMPGLGGEVVKAAGATVVNVPGGEILTSLQSGMIDAAEWIGPYNDLAFGLHKVARHYYYPGWHEPGAVLDCFINLGAWNALPPDLQQIVENACRATNGRILNEMTARNASALAALSDRHGVKPEAFPPALLAELQALAATTVAAIAAADPMSRRVYDSLEKFRKEAKAWSNIAEQAYMASRG